MSPRAPAVPGMLFKPSYMDDFDYLEGVRLRAALAGRPIVLLEKPPGAKPPRRLPNRARMVLPHGRIVYVAEARAAGIGENAMVEHVPPRSG